MSWYNETMNATNSVIDKVKSVLGGLAAFGFGIYDHNWAPHSLGSGPDLMLIGGGLAILTGVQIFQVVQNAQNTPKTA